MFSWEGRMLDNKSIQAVKAALPFLDISVGERIDMEGLLRAVRCFCHEKEQKIIDMILNFLMMKRMMSLMNVMKESQHTEQGMEGVFEMLKSQMPEEQREMFDMMSMMMTMPDISAASEPEEDEVDETDAADATDETDETEPEPMPVQIPPIWQRIVENNDKGNAHD